MDLRQLRYFAQIVESGSLSKASRQLYIAQPALSQQVSKLEEEVGKPLLNRSSRGVAPTENGLALYHLLEEQVVPAYYERDEKGVPRRWVEMMKEAIATISPRFSSDRMVRDYCERAYLPLLTRD